MHFAQNKLDQTRRIYSRQQGTLIVRDGTPIPKPCPTPETVNATALATLLYSGMVLPPDTIFRDFLAVGAGGTLSVEEGRDSYREIEDLFDDELDSEGSLDPIDWLAEAMDRSEVDFSQCKLLLSEGKDSTGIAIALAELGVKVDCVTFANSDSNVELVTEIAQRLGHRLEIVRYDNYTLSEEALSRLSAVFEPTVDQAFLSYLLLPMDLFQGCTIIDGMGNDLYMGHIPSLQQLRATQACQAASWFAPPWVRNRFKGKLFRNSEYCGIPFRTFTECQGLYNGFDRNEIHKLVAEPRTLKQIDTQWKQLGFEKARALSRGRYLDTYNFCGKSISLAEMASAKVYFPWADESIAKRFSRLPSRLKFHWPTKNKLLLRQAINRRFDYRQPKVGFRAPVQEIIDCNRQLLESAVRQSSLIPEPLKREVFMPSKYENRLVACALIALWEHSSKNTSS